MLFRDRIHAGQLLGEDLKRRGFGRDYLVLALPRGGVPVAFEVARKIGSQMDIFVVRKLGVPGHEELAMGAIGPNQSVVLNEAVVTSIGITEKQIQEVIDREEAEMQRRLKEYRAGRKPLKLDGRAIILVDDGLATGASMRVACQAIKKIPIQSLLVAVPVGASNSCRELKNETDEIICLHTPEPFYGVGQWYADFSQTTDEDVMRIMEESTHLNNLYSAL